MSQQIKLILAREPQLRHPSSLSNEFSNGLVPFLGQMNAVGRPQCSVAQRNRGRDVNENCLMWVARSELLQSRVEFAPVLLQERQLRAASQPHGWDRHDDGHQACIPHRLVQASHRGKGFVWWQEMKYIVGTSHNDDGVVLQPLMEQACQTQSHLTALLTRDPCVRDHGTASHLPQSLCEPVCVWNVRSDSVNVTRREAVSQAQDCAAITQCLYVTLRSLHCANPFGRGGPQHRSSREQSKPLW